MVINIVLFCIPPMFNMKTIEQNKLEYQEKQRLIKHKISCFKTKKKRKKS